jgi:tetrahydromethanopterin S-methyltransferase subunit G
MSEQDKILSVLVERQANIASKLDEIHVQVKNTNGRVTSLEAWKNFISGAIAILTFFSSYIFFT